MAGVGKTVLALHAAHRMADRFPDGQLFIDLRGHTPDMAPLEPGEALDAMLRALGVPVGGIPRASAERAGLFRSLLADRRALVVLDNAADERQVQPLLPGSPGCHVLITSRRRLTGLDHTHTVALSALPVGDAIALFRSVAGEARLATTARETLLDIVRLCGLVRVHAATVAGDETPAAARAAVDRLLDHYARAASAMVGVAYPHERSGGSTGSSPAGAAVWLDTELPNLLATARYAADNGRPDHVVHLSRARGPRASPAGVGCRSLWFCSGPCPAVGPPRRASGRPDRPRPCPAPAAALLGRQRSARHASAGEPDRVVGHCPTGR